jgi:hypothetical protein
VRKTNQRASLKRASETLGCSARANGNVSRARYVASNRHSDPKSVEGFERREKQQGGDVHCQHDVEAGFMADGRCSRINCKRPYG